MFITEPLGYFFVHSLNGLGYGILYNFVLGAVLSTQFKKDRITPMGVYQAVLAIGITASGAFTQLIKNNLHQDFFIANRIIDGILIAIICSMAGIYVVKNRYIPDNGPLKISISG